MENKILKIIELLENNYVYPNKIKEVKKLLLSKKENYEKLSDVNQELKNDIRSVLNDKHISIKILSNTNNIEHFDKEWLNNTKKLNKKLGYIEFKEFPDFDTKHKEDIISTVINSYKTVVDCPNLIFDLSNNRGGCPLTVQFMLSFLFSKRTLLNKIYFRIPSTKKYNVEKFYTYTNKELEKMSGLDITELPFFYEKKIFVIVGSKTFSAGEEFAKDIQAQKRGTIIGEITRGGANPVDYFEIDKKTIFQIPIGYSYNPITKDNWEGIGIKPDILCVNKTSKKIINEIKKII